MKKNHVAVLVLASFIAGIAGCGPAQKTEAKGVKDTTVVVDTVKVVAVDTTKTDATKVEPAKK